MGKDCNGSQGPQWTVALELRRIKLVIKVLLLLSCIMYSNSMRFYFLAITG